MGALLERAQPFFSLVGRHLALHGHVPPPLELVGSEVWQTFHEAPPQGGESGSQTRTSVP